MSKLALDEYAFELNAMRGRARADVILPDFLHSFNEMRIRELASVSFR
jgi:hypothetical protein